MAGNLIASAYYAAINADKMTSVTKRSYSMPPIAILINDKLKLILIPRVRNSITHLTLVSILTLSELELKEELNQLFRQ